MLKAICFAVSFLGIMVSFGASIPFLLLSVAEGDSKKFFYTLASLVMLFVFSRIFRWSGGDEEKLGG